MWIPRLLVPLLGIALMLPTSALARPPLELGVQDDPTFVRHPLSYGGTFLSGNPLAASEGYTAARRLGTHTLKINVIWSWIAPTAHDPNAAPGPSDWSLYERAVDEAIAAGLEPQLTLTGPAPAWATGSGRAGVHRPSPALFARFAAEAATHFRGRVRRYAIWNEPNWPSWLQPARSAAGQYRELYRAAYGAISAADPNARVLFGELAPMGRPEAAIPPLRFLRDVLCVDRRLRSKRACPRLRAHGFAHHPYTLRWRPRFPGRTPDDVTTGSLRRLTRALDVLARRGRLATPSGRPLDLYLTEYGWHANSGRFPERQRKRLAPAGYELAARNPRVRQIVWYQLVAPPPSAHRVWDTALLRRDGTPRPTFHALRRWARSALAAGRLRRPS